MGFGVAYPLRFTGRGGLATTDDNLVTLIALSLLPGLSNNPFNERDGVGAPDFTWEANSAEGEALMTSRIEARFGALERQGRAQLDRVFRREPIGADPGVFNMVINWTNLETGTSDTTVLPSET